jgi:hypothetical protein
LQTPSPPPPFLTAISALLHSVENILDALPPSADAPIPPLTIPTVDTSRDDPRSFVYFDVLELHPLLLNVTFSGTGALQRTLSRSIPVFDALTVMMTNVDNAVIALNALFLERPSGHQTEFFRRIIAHYRNSFVRAAFAVMGSVDLLGNPVGLVTNIGTGMLDFFYEPANALVHGPDQFGKGLAKGTLSLVKNSVFGTFNTVSKISGSVGKGLGMLAMDEEYQRRRYEGARDRPSHFIDGLKQVGGGGG